MNKLMWNAPLPSVRTLCAPMDRALGQITALVCTLFRYPIGATQSGCPFFTAASIRRLVFTLSSLLNIPFVAPAFPSLPVPCPAPCTFPDHAVRG